MATLQASRVLEALQRARRIGRTEEQFQIDGCPIVIQNLSSEEYIAIDAEIQDTENVEYLHAFQVAHLCRAIVEIGGVDLRQVDFVEDEIPANQVVLSASLPKSRAQEVLDLIAKFGGQGTVAPDGTQQVKLERHEWVRQRVMPGWSREALSATWRKFADVLQMAEDKSRSGIKFRVPEETAEDRYRRLLGEIREVEPELPTQMVDSILSDVGYLRKSSKEELDVVEQKMRKLSENLPTETPADIMATRKPLNVADSPAVSVPVKPPTASPSVVSPPVGGEVLTSKSSARSRQIAELEADMGSLSEMPLQTLPTGGDLVQQPQPDVAAVVAAVDRPPVVGVNPRFKPQQR